jgi:phage gp46-like protein
MTDLALVLSPDGTRFDIAVSGYDLAAESGLRSAVILSLYTDRRAEADDVLPDGTDNRRGWWADPKLGSRLWLLTRAKETDDVLARAREYAIEALTWLLDDKVASAVDAKSEWVRRGVLGLTVTITLADRTQFQDLFNVPLEAA